MIENDYFSNSKKINLQINPLSCTFDTNSEVLKNNIIEILLNNPNFVLYLIENKKFSLDDIDEDLLHKFFSTCCNMLKEIERNSKVLGLKLIDQICELLPQEYFMNAYVFEKELAKAFKNVKTKIVSMCDYELAKVDCETKQNYGFFAAALEEEKKEIKILALSLISKLGSFERMKEFSIISFKYVIELVNDEEDEVRYETCKCLESLIKNFKIIEVRRIFLFINIIPLII